MCILSALSGHDLFDIVSEFVVPLILCIREFPVNRFVRTFHSGVSSANRVTSGNCSSICVMINSPYPLRKCSGATKIRPIFILLPSRKRIASPSKSTSRQGAVKITLPIMCSGFCVSASTNVSAHAPSAIRKALRRQRARSIA